MGSFNSLHTNFLTTPMYTSMQKRVNIASLRLLSLKRHAFNTELGKRTKIQNAKNYL